MSWTNVKLVFQREVRDQLRDRRTLFTIAILPLVLYPLMGMSFLQIAQFMQEHPSRVTIVGVESLPASPVFLTDGQIAEPWCSDEERRLLAVKLVGRDAYPEATRTQEVRNSIQDGRCDVVVVIPTDFASQIEHLRASLRPGATDPSAVADPPAKLTPEVYLSSANDRSRIAAQRIEAVLKRWREALVRESLAEHQIPASAVSPFEITDRDVAEVGRRRAAIWSKVLPFVVLIWALTGAFYPAVDLCAGEKERGTLETLLSSPAERSEIVWGKLLTVMLFSITTSLLNMLSLTFTTTLFVHQLDSAHPLAGGLMGAPPVAALGWLVLILIPVSALFSALALAVASFARSSKEGQYYLMPLLLVTLPLMILPLLPSAELNLGTSLIPVTGAMLLVRALIEGQYAEALVAFPTVVIMTAAGCMLAIRWAIEQFNNESVLFRESERWDVRLLLLHLVRDREATPTFGQAMLCGIILLVVRFFASVSTAGLTGKWEDFAASTVVGQAGFILAPPLLLTVLLTRSPRATLLLARPRWWAVPAAALLAAALHPASLLLSQLIQKVYPVSARMIEEHGKLEGLFNQAPSIWAIVGVLAFIPALCEELAFRGFIQSGLASRSSRWTAILISAAFFGAVHGIVQQALSAFILGLVIGYLAAASRSIWPCMVFHFVHNGLHIVLGLSLPKWMETHPWLGRVVISSDAGHAFATPILVGGLAVAGLVLYAFRRDLQQREQAALESTDAELELDARRHSIAS
ncbi:MAG: ABC transporter permease subunit/CPBP intramembrane protease [Pirellulales bacterium]